MSTRNSLHMPARPIICALVIMITIALASAGIARAQSSANAAPAITLEQLQQMALANNPTLEQAKAGVRAATGRTRQAGLWPNPTIGYLGDEIRGGSFGGGEQGAFVQPTILTDGRAALITGARRAASPTADGSAARLSVRG